MARSSESEEPREEAACETQPCLCPLGGVMDLLSRKYAMQLICVVDALGPVRYGGIEDTFGDVSSSTLSTRLEELVDAGLLSREQYAEVPPRVEYELTEVGEQLGDLIEPLLEWAEAQDSLPSDVPNE
jgi:DNA-binding HxlR family transcriptional regulator